MPEKDLKERIICCLCADLTAVCAPCSLKKDAVGVVQAVHVI